jgi:hypothetical protein
MCGIIDDALPILGGIAGTFIAPGIGTAIGAGLGGAVGNYAQTHNFGSALESGAISGGTSALGSWAGPSLGSLGAGDAALSTAQQGASTLGDVEQGAGGAALFGPAAGTGTAIGGAAGGLGGAGLGVAGGSSLADVGSGLGYLSGLGGTTSGTGLGLGGTGSSADLNGVMNATQGPGGLTSASPVPTALGQTTPTAGATGVSSPTGANSIGSLSNTGSVGMEGTGSPMGFDQTGGAQFTDAGAQAAAPQGSLSSMYGPTSMAGGSPQGALIAQSGGLTDSGGAAGGVQFGPMGQGTAGSLGSEGASPTLGSIFGDTGTDMKLLNTGLNAYQQFAQQNAANNYKNSINNIFSPTGAYAQQMQSNIAREYAAKGMNAEKGPQGVQLAAALAQAQAQALGGSNYASAARNTSGANALNGLFANFSTPQAQQGLTNFGKNAFQGLQTLWS